MNSPPGLKLSFRRTRKGMFFCERIIRALSVSFFLAAAFFLAGAFLALLFSLLAWDIPPFDPQMRWVVKNCE